MFVQIVWCTSENRGHGPAFPERPHFIRRHDGVEDRTAPESSSGFPEREGFASAARHLNGVRSEECPRLLGDHVVMREDLQVDERIGSRRVKQTNASSGYARRSTAACPVRSPPPTSESRLSTPRPCPFPPPFQTVTPAWGVRSAPANGPRSPAAAPPPKWL